MHSDFTVPVCCGFLIATVLPKRLAMAATEEGLELAETADFGDSELQLGQEIKDYQK